MIHSTIVKTASQTNPRTLYLVKQGAFYRQNDLLVSIGDQCCIITRPFHGSGVEIIKATAQGGRRSKPIEYTGIREWYEKAYYEACGELLNPKIRNIQAVDLETARIVRIA